jgi:hypothetical protein
MRTMLNRKLLHSLLMAAPLAACGVATETSTDGDGTDVAVSGLQVQPDSCPEDVGKFREATADEKDAAMSAHPGLDPEGVVPADLLASAVGFFDVNKDQIQNQSYVTIVDFSKSSSKSRFFMVNMDTGAVEPHQVAHGSGSDPNRTGTATIFSNKANSYQSSLGYFRTMDTYDGTHVHSLQIEGLSTTDDQVCQRHIIVHEAAYVHDNGQKTGWSEGCFALQSTISNAVVDKIKHGSIIYAGRSTQ